MKRRNSDRLKLRAARKRRKRLKKVRRDVKRMLR